jgi:hypothetical protein
MTYIDFREVILAEGMGLAANPLHHLSHCNHWSDREFEGHSVQLGRAANHQRRFKLP